MGAEWLTETICFVRLGPSHLISIGTKTKQKPGEAPSVSPNKHVSIKQKSVSDVSCLFFFACRAGTLCFCSVRPLYNLPSFFSIWIIFSGECSASEEYRNGKMGRTYEYFTCFWWNVGLALAAILIFLCRLKRFVVVSRAGTACFCLRFGRHDSSVRSIDHFAHASYVAKDKFSFYGLLPSEIHRDLQNVIVEQVISDATSFVRTV